MNKQDLVSAVADASGLTKADAAKAVEATFDAITGALKKGRRSSSGWLWHFCRCKAQGIDRPQSAYR
jgi:hypothetical protein